MSETELREAARMLVYLWEAETLNGTRVCDLFYDDDPLTQDVPRILASIPAEPEQGDEVAPLDVEGWDQRTAFSAAERALAVPHRDDDQPCGCDDCMGYGAEDAGADWFRIPTPNRIVIRALDSGDERLAPLAKAVAEHDAEYARLALASAEPVPAPLDVPRPTLFVGHPDGTYSEAPIVLAQVLAYLHGAPGFSTAFVTDAERELALRIAAAYPLAVEYRARLAPARDDTSAWLIERGQSERQVPTVWWTGSSWSSDANKAMRFPDRDAAAAYNEEHSPIPAQRDRFGRVTEHRWLPDTSGGAS